MTQTSRPWNGTTVGDSGPYSDSDWQELYTYIIGLGANRANSGVFLMSGAEPNDGLKVTANSPATTAVNVLAGAALVTGLAYINTATVSFTIAANGSGNPRIDTIVLRKDYALQTCILAVLQGTPAASPSAPSLTQTAGTLWEIPIADIAVANGFTSISDSNISPRQNWVNAPPAVYLDHILNNSGAALNDGDVVIWDATADRAVTVTTTQEDILVAGVWRGQTAAAGYGRLQVRGIGYIRTNAAITRGNQLSTSTTSKQATFVGARPYAMVARALETTSGAGLCLANIAVILGRPLQYVTTADKTIASSGAETTLFSATGIGTLTIPANVLAQGFVIEIELRGTFSTAAVPGTITVKSKLGGTVLCNSAAVTPTANIATQEIVIRTTMIVRAGGAGGSVIASGEASWTNSAAGAQRAGLQTVGATAFNLTASQVIDVTWQWSSGVAANTITINTAVVKVTGAV